MSARPASRDRSQGRVAGTRELVIAPFVIVYRVRKMTIDILAIIHSARRWPESF